MYAKYTVTTANDSYTNAVSFMTSCGYTVVATDVLVQSTNHSTIFKDVISDNVIFISDGGLGKGDGLCISVFQKYDSTKDFMHQPRCMAKDGTLGMVEMITNTGIMHCNYNSGTCMFSIQNQAYTGNTESLVFGNVKFLTDTNIDGGIFLGILHNSKYEMYLRAKTDDRDYEWLSTEATKAKLIMSWAVSTTVPHYYDLLTADTPGKETGRPGHKLTRTALGSTLSCSSIIMPTIFYCNRVPLSSETISAIAVSDIIGAVDMFNMSTGHLKQQDFPEKSSYRCYNDGSRRSGLGYFGIAFKQEE